MTPYVMLIWLAGEPGYQYLGPYNSQTGCWIDAMQVEAQDERITKTQCVPYNDPTPYNMG